MTQKLPENLPADLPENWQTNEIISPEGTEVGLTPQHGYNYLMKQVNDAQKSINNIVSAFGDVAQQSTVDTINSKIGNPSDITDRTLFGKIHSGFKTQGKFKITETKLEQIKIPTRNKIPLSITFKPAKISKFGSFRLTASKSSYYQAYIRLVAKNYTITMADGSKITIMSGLPENMDEQYQSTILMQGGTRYLGISQSIFPALQFDYFQNMEPTATVAFNSPMYTDLWFSEITVSFSAQLTVDENATIDVSAFCLEEIE